MTMIQIGGNVDGWCTRCKLVLAHTIEAAVGSTIKRVHCNTCKSKHVYRSAEPGLPKAARQLGSKPSAGLARASHYDTLMKNRDPAGARQYSFRDRYESGQVVTHNDFGMGIVTADKGSHKIEVLFQSGPKVLVHERS